MALQTKRTDEAALLLGRKLPDWTLVEDEASRLLASHDVYEPPIPIDEMVRAQNLRIQFGHLPSKQSSVAGFIRLSERMIYVNAADAPRRQTFTIAHELGHWVLHRRLLEAHPEMYRVLRRDRPVTAPTPPLEQEANGFAGRLLVPRKFLDRFWRGVTVRPNASTLARIFSVSEDVIRFRLKFEYGHEA
jgi:Zn-dependent peptidase ImmA (M78 family)